MKNTIENELDEMDELFPTEYIHVFIIRDGDDYLLFNNITDEEYFVGQQVPSEDEIELFVHGR